MKIFYNILAIILGVILFFTLMPAMILLIQMCLILLFVICEILLLPICIAVVVLAYQKVKEKSEN
jgi:hypothetical protein